MSIRYVMSSCCRLLRSDPVSVRLKSTVMSTTQLPVFTQHTRSVSGRVFKFLQSQKTLLQKDNVPSSFELIYKAPMDTYITMSSTIVTVTTTMLGALAVWKYLIMKDFSSDPIIFGDDDQVLAANGTEVAIYFGLFVFFAAGLKIMSMRMVLRIYNCDSRYIAVFRGILPGFSRLWNFNAGQASHTPPSGILPWGNSRYRLAGRRVLIMQECFRTPSDYNIMLGKPSHSTDPSGTL